MRLKLDEAREGTQLNDLIVKLGPEGISQFLQEQRALAAHRRQGGRRFAN